MQLIPFLVKRNPVTGDKAIDVEAIKELVAPLGIKVVGCEAEFAGAHLLICDDGIIRNVRGVSNLRYRLKEAGSEIPDFIKAAS